MTITHPSTRPPSDLIQQTYVDQINATLFDRMIAEAHSQQSRDDLSRTIGGTDETLLAELADLGFVRQTLVTLRLMPLVLVAWADNHVDPKERAVILEAARRLGICKDTDAFLLLDHWLKHKPPAEMTDAWKRYTCGLMKSFGAAPRQRLVENIRRQMLSVANASGGVLGLGRVSSKERAVINLLSGLLKACAAAS